MLLIPEYAVEMLNIIKNAGYEAYAVGGCVRDALLGTKPADVDVTTSAAPDVIRALFPESVMTGGKYYTVTAFHSGGKAEITPFRSESGYSDSRRPDSVSLASDLTDDLKRRDFTMNAICFDGENVIDPLGGKADIESGVIRCVGDPELRFNEDALRIMRAFRFSAELGFEIERETLSAALASAHKLRNISVERIRDELIKIALSPAPEKLAPLLESGALGFINLGPSPLIEKIKSLTDNDGIRLSALLNVCGSDSVGLLRLPNRLKRFIRGVFDVLDAFPPPLKSSVKRIMSLHGADVFLAAAEISEKLHGADGKCAALCRVIVSGNEPYRISDLAVNGTDLINAGVPKEDVGGILNRLLDAVIESPGLNTREALINLITK